LIGNNITGSSFTGSFTGSFFGDGRDLFNLPQATRLSTGSVTASVTPQFGFKVESISSGSQFTGSLFVSGNVTAQFYFGDGSNLLNVPSTVAPRIASGSVTASIAPNTGFIVNTFAQFEFPVSASMFSGSGRGLFDIPRSALTPDALTATLIATGSVTASVSPNYGFKVEASEFGSQFTGSLFVSG
jgi:hypothetical protein